MDTTIQPDPLRDPDVLERILRAALSKGDIDGVGHALRLMAPVDPRRAVRLYDELKFAVRLDALVQENLS